MTQQPFENDDYARLVHQMTRDLEKMAQRPVPVVDVGATRIDTDGIWHVDPALIDQTQKHIDEKMRVLAAEHLAQAPASPPVEVHLTADVNDKGHEETAPPKEEFRREPEGWTLPVDKKGRPHAVVSLGTWALNSPSMSSIADRFLATREAPKNAQQPIEPPHRHEGSYGPTGSRGPTGHR